MDTQLLATKFLKQNSFQMLDATNLVNFDKSQWWVFLSAQYCKNYFIF